MKVNGQIPEIKDGEADESKPMYQDPTSSGHHGSNGNQNHVHEEAPVDLLTMTESENQFQVSLRYLFPPLKNSDDNLLRINNV